MSGNDTSNATPNPPDQDTVQREADATENKSGGTMSDITSMIGNHKGKLAVGAAAMLGLAVFYKWRESKLATDDPEEFARLQRLKVAVGGNPTDPDDTAEPEDGK